MDPLSTRCFKALYLVTNLCIAQGWLAPLELLPCLQGVESDVVLYASGNVQTDDGDWDTGPSAAMDAPAGTAPA